MPDSLLDLVTQGFELPHRAHGGYLVLCPCSLSLFLMCTHNIPSLCANGEFVITYFLSIFAETVFYAPMQHVTKTTMFK